MPTCSQRLSIFPRTALVENHHLSVAGCELAALAAQYGTPLYVYDAATVEHQVAYLKRLLQVHYPAGSSIAYATKAYFSLAFAQKLVALGTGADLITMGDIRTAQRAGFSPELLHLHGNNKSAEELTAALQWGIGAIVVDSLDELAFLELIAAQLQIKARIWLRITPDIQVDTHHHIQTSHVSSKFGLHVADGQADLAIQQALKSKWIDLVGLHTHLGSQLRDTAVYQAAISKIYAVAAANGFIPREFSPGGGWGVRYTEKDTENDAEAWIAAISKSVQSECASRGWALPHLVIEPGRFTVAQAGVALYAVGAQKQTPEGQHIIAVDGGIADNPRVALYNAQYTALIANRADMPCDVPCRVVGKFCETGDVLIEEVSLPEAARGDILAIPAAGAYQLSMASNYNFATRPTVLWLEGGKAEVMQQREQIEGHIWWYR